MLSKIRINSIMKIFWNLFCGKVIMTNLFFFYLWLSSLCILPCNISLTWIYIFDCWLCFLSLMFIKLAFISIFYLNILYFTGPHQNTTTHNTRSSRFIKLFTFKNLAIYLWFWFYLWNNGFAHFKMSFRAILSSNCKF